MNSVSATCKKNGAKRCQKREQLSQSAREATETLLLAFSLLSSDCPPARSPFCTAAFSWSSPFAAPATSAGIFRRLSQML